ncbi:ribosomal-processing cysteine protease Prp [Garciella nitratireducens]|uniref:Ribosomal processing cysteine protease Prp n=1 Tax=Garciella nitratireducens DSM 15102 TaxID=1121911 RepID=A0A1T4KSK4_9FIRM|nr:ribosomal-processing cysteine protease Prp [Garciella nitratireducens]RBP39555.1 hypothetical protein DFR81_11525 [Garciella nitratireducens]SJZ45412.1 hypothetical protein SAMN02745973_00691 [Garciella nitratireducens DSM 15102]
MIQINVWEDEEQKIKKFLVKGHAGYGEEGWDIVCSAVSALTIATLNGLTEYVSIPLDIEIEDGYVYCAITTKMSKLQTIQSQAILQTMKLAFENIVDEYGEYVKMDKMKI